MKYQYNGNRKKSFIILFYMSRIILDYTHDLINGPDISVTHNVELLFDGISWKLLIGKSNMNGIIHFTEVFSWETNLEFGMPTRLSDSVVN